jgi:uncharacterized protein
MKKNTRNKILLAISLLYILTIGNAYALGNGVTIPLVADKISDNGEEGELLSAQVIVTNGTGHVFVDTNPYTQVDLQGSARIAATVASDVLGIDQKSHDFYYIIDMGSPIIGGPSAGGVLTVATIAAINNWTIKPGIVMTGMIDPDETIGPVGGIPFKLEAAAAKNTKLFLVPQGQLIVNITNTAISTEPSMAHLTTEKSIDLVKLGKQLNVGVKEVSTIQDAVLEFTGHDISEPFINNSVYTPNYLNLLQHLSAQLRNESKSMYKDTIPTDNKVVLKNTLDLQNKADDLANNKKYYTATSMYFQSMVDMLKAQWDYQYDKAHNKDQYIKNITGIVEKQINNSENDLDKFKSNGVSDIEIAGAAESRIMEASSVLDNVKNLNNSNDIISSLVFANERAKSAQWWLTLAVPSKKIIPEDVLKERAGWYQSQAQSVSIYAQSLLSDTGHPVNNFAGTPIAQKEIDRGYYSGAILDSLQVISMSGTAIELLGIQDVSKIDQSSMAAEAAINHARSKGIEPTLAVSIFEYGESLSNPYGKVSQYSYAKMVAKTTESIYIHTISSNQTVTNPSINESTTPVPTNKAPAFGAFALLVIVLLVRRLRR